MYPSSGQLDDIFWSLVTGVAVIVAVEAVEVLFRLLKEHADEEKARAIERERTLEVERERVMERERAEKARIEREQAEKALAAKELAKKAYNKPLCYAATFPLLLRYPRAYIEATASPLLSIPNPKKFY